MSANERMSAVGSLLSGVGGFLGGVVAVAGLLMARPDVITIVVPVERLERVVDEAKAETEAEPPAPANAETQPPAPVVAPPQALAPAQSLEGGVSATLVSLASTADAYVANLRLTNGSDAPMLIAGRARPYGGDFNVSDSLGGSCPWRANGESLGTLTPASGDRPINPNNYTPIAPGQSTTVTLIFHRFRCDVAPSGNGPVNLNGTFVIVQNDAPRFAAVSFEGVVPAQP